MFDDDGYFVFVDKYFSTQADRLRHDVDDKYSKYFEERLQRYRDIFGEVKGEILATKTRSIEEYTRKQLTRRGLDILCRRRRHEDLSRIRKSVSEQFAKLSRLDAEYMEKFGEWEDIELLANPGEGLSFLTGGNSFIDAAARAIYRIGRDRICDLLALEMHSHIFKRVIEISAITKFAEVSDDVLLGILYHKTPEVRKVAAIKAVLAFSSSRTESILNTYRSRDRAHYYNVVHWLDLGVSMTRKDAQTVARKSLSQCDK